MKLYFISCGPYTGQVIKAGDEQPQKAITCGCGTRFTLEDVKTEDVTQLGNLHVVCPQCGQKHDLYSQASLSLPVRKRLKAEGVSEDSLDYLE